MNFKYPVFLLPFLFCSIINAQNKATIIDELVRKNSSEGVISINSDPQITGLIGKPLVEINSSNESFVKLPGYRIQAFSGSQRESKDEAYSKAKEVRDAFPDVSTYVTYKAPVFRLRLGDFQTNEEAVTFMRELKKKLPALGKEMYVVTEEIKVVL